MTFRQSKTHAISYLMNLNMHGVPEPSAPIRTSDAMLWHALSLAESRAAIHQIAERYRLSNPDASRRIERAVFAGVSYAEIVDGFSTVDGEA